MKYLLLVIFILTTNVFAQVETLRPYQYLKNEVQNAEKPYRFNEYETIISGGLAFLVGNIGFYTTKSETLKFAYAGIQTVGIITVGQGVYDYYSPDQDKEMLGLLNTKKLSRSQMADGFIALLGREERAKRLAILYGSSLLVIQYAANAYLSEIPSDIRDVYLFLGGVNVIVAGHSFFSRGKYEGYLDSKDKISWSPFLTPNRAGLLLTKSF